MEQLQCAYCFSTKVKRIAAYETREVTVIECRNCGRISEIDTENFVLPTSDTTQGTQ